MKKLKPFFFTAILSTVLVGNVFAGDLTANGVCGFFDSIVNAVVSFASGSSVCEGRQCQTCRPREEGGEGNCRPTQ